MEKVTVLDVFSGAGGFSCGFEMAGCEIIGAIERDKWAADTFCVYHKRAKMLLGDIEGFCSEELKNALPESPDIIIGGPPCQGFSVCTKNAGDPKDSRNSLFVEFIRMAKVFSSPIMIMENVPNIAKATTKHGEGVVSIICKEFEKLGYHVYSTILSASDYGIPQMRQRFILIASKRELAHPFPKPTHHVFKNSYRQATSFIDNELLPCPTLWNAISDLPDIEACEGAEVMPYTKPANNYY